LTGSQLSEISSKVSGSENGPVAISRAGLWEEPLEPKL
jgi:hypothetical protein